MPEQTQQAREVWVLEADGRPVYMGLTREELPDVAEGQTITRYVPEWMDWPTATLDPLEVARRLGADERVPLSAVPSELQRAWKLNNNRYTDQAVDALIMAITVLTKAVERLQPRPGPTMDVHHL